jgi:hypothetical protein
MTPYEPQGRGSFITYDRPKEPKYDNAGRDIRYFYDKPIKWKVPSRD